MLTWILESGCLEAEVSQIRLWDQTGEGGAVVQVHVTAKEILLQTNMLSAHFTWTVDTQ